MSLSAIPQSDILKAISDAECDLEFGRPAEYTPSPEEVIAMAAQRLGLPYQAVADVWIIHQVGFG